MRAWATQPTSHSQLESSRSVPRWRSYLVRVRVRVSLTLTLTLTR